MKHSIKIFVLLSCLWILSSCGPMTPDSYMNQYAQFVEDLQNNHDNYSTAQWDDQYKKFQRFNDAWYDRVEDRLGMSQKIEVSKLSYTAGLLFAEKYGVDIFKMLPDMVSEMMNTPSCVEFEEFETALDQMGEEIETSVELFEEAIDGLFDDND